MSKNNLTNLKTSFRLHRIEQEYETLKQEAPRLHAEIAKLRTVIIVFTLS